MLDPLQDSFEGLVAGPPLFCLPFLMGLGHFQRVLANHMMARVPLTTCLLSISAGFGFPATIAIFPQICSIDPDQVEAKFQHIANCKTPANMQKPCTVYYYNKGF
jgi:hypothetical protein